MAAHGYTVQWGFFNGTCRGSNNLPFEQSKDLIDESIARATNELVSCDIESDTLKNGQMLSSNFAWQLVYEKAIGKSVWQIVNIGSEQVDMGDGRQFTRYFSVDKDNRKELLYIYEADLTLDKVRACLNRQYAEQHLDARIRRLNDYVKWQKERIKNWNPSELHPVEA